MKEENSRDILNNLAEAMMRMVERIFKKELNNANIEYAYKGIVTDIRTEDTTVDGKVITVTTAAKVDIGDSTTDYIPNYTGRNLKIGDMVKVFSNKRDMVGAYIGVRMEKLTASEL